MRVHATENVTATLTSEPGKQPEVAVEARTINALLSLPPGFGGQKREDTANPEQLFGGALTGCFAFAVQYVGRRARADVDGLVCRAEVRVGQARDLGNELEVDVVVELPGVPQDQAEELVANARRYCPFHRAIEGNVRETITVRGSDRGAE
jgi:Ohr subfamily peroxiredoxin